MPHLPPIVIPPLLDAETTNPGAHAGRLNLHINVGNAPPPIPVPAPRRNVPVVNNDAPPRLVIPGAAAAPSEQVRTPPGAVGRPRLHDEGTLRPRCIYCRNTTHPNYDCDQPHKYCADRRQCRVPHNHTHRHQHCEWRDADRNIAPRPTRHQPYPIQHPLPARPELSVNSRPLAQRIRPAREDGEVSSDDDQIDWSRYADVEV
ncbi:hypothetical protein EDB89DRAFT_2077659 [Lactarius sanguifluus]|nr:hypothetical protein EDB89DRAFT_2077659 [Lactarius sanguifluus]